MTVQKGGWDYFDDNLAGVTLYDQLAGERNAGATNEYMVGVDECEYAIWTHDDGDSVITSNPAILFGVRIVSALTGDAAIRDGTTAGGTLLLTTGSTLNTEYDMKGIKCDSGIFVDDNATGGSLMIMYRDQ